MKTTHKSPTSSWASTVIAIVLVIAALSLAQRVLIPLALAILLTFVLSPLTTRVQYAVRYRVPAALLVVLFSFALLTGVGWLVAAQAGELGSELPSYRENIMRKVRSARAALGGSIAPVSQTLNEIGREITSRPASQPAADESPSRAARASTAREDDGIFGAMLGRLGMDPARSTPADERTPVPVTITEDGSRYLSLLSSVAASFMDWIATMGITAVFVALLLVQREELRDRLILLFGRQRHSITIEAMDDAARRVSRYLVTLVGVNALHGTVVAVGMLAMGLPGALLWGVLAALLRFIPFVGTWIATAMPTILALAVFDGWTRALLVVMVFLVSDLTINSVLEPWLYGARTGAAPIAILVSTVFWTWLWGGVGLFLATPLTVCLVVLARYVPQFSALGMLLGNEPALPPRGRLYNRLLARDAPGAEELVRQALREASPAKVCDTLIVPALAELERDQHHPLGAGHRDAFIRRTVLELVDDAVEQAGAAGDSAGDGTIIGMSAGVAEPPPRVVCLPAGGWIDELAAQMAARLLSGAGIPATVGSTRVLTSELLDRLRAEAPQAVCICALPLSPLSRVRYLCKRLHQSLPGVGAVALVWNDPDGEPERLRSPLDAETHTITRMVELPDAIRPMLSRAVAAPIRLAAVPAEVIPETASSPA